MVTLYYCLQKSYSTFFRFQALFRNCLVENAKKLNAEKLNLILRRIATTTITTIEQKNVTFLKNKWRSANALTTCPKVTWEQSYLQQFQLTKVLNTGLNRTHRIGTTLSTWISEWTAPRQSVELTDFRNVLYCVVSFFNCFAFSLLSSAYNLMYPYHHLTVEL